MRSLSLAFIIGIFVGSAVAEQLSATSLSILLIALLLAGIFLKSEKLRTMTFFLAFFAVGVLRICIDGVPLQMEGVIATLTPLREQLCQGFARFGISGDENAVVTAMVLGDKSGLTTQLKSIYSQAGASHVLALSGMHLAIIYFMLSWLVKRVMLCIYYIPELLWEKLPVEKNLRLKGFMRVLLAILPSERAFLNITSFIILLIIWLYVILVGMSPSVVRSAMMLTIYGLSRMLFRQLDTNSVLALTAFITLMLSPWSLFDVGFQMSYLAVFGIGVYMPRLMQFIYKVGPGRLEGSIGLALRKALIWVFTTLSLSLSAQILIMPLVAFYFHTLPCYGIISSLVVSVTAMLIVGLSLVFLMSLFMPFTFLSECLSYMLNAVTHYQNVFLEYVTALPFAVAEVDINIWQLLIIYVLIFCVSRIVFILQPPSCRSGY